MCAGRTSHLGIGLVVRRVRVLLEDFELLCDVGAMLVNLLLAVGKRLLRLLERLHTHVGVRGTCKRAKRQRTKRNIDMKRRETERRIDRYGVGRQRKT